MVSEHEDNPKPLWNSIVWSTISALLMGVLTRPPNSYYCYFYRPPPGLRGREIGLWYASRQKERNKETEKQNVSLGILKKKYDLSQI